MTQWSVQVTSVTFNPLTDDQRGRLDAALDAATLDNAETGAMVCGFTVEADNRKAAAQNAARAFAAASRDTLGETLPFIGVAAARPGKELAFVLPAVVGYIEIAAILGHTKGARKPLSRQRAREIAEDTPGFPAPVARLATGPVFALDDVMEFARTWTGKPGRPRKTA
ncbi:MAG TPA: hypothetical protein VIS29_16110 [Streptomyces sp.]|jgi:hypothetical protein